jgi:hypothetical protein
MNVELLLFFLLLTHFTHPMNFLRLRQQKDAADEKMLRMKQTA